MTDPPTPLAPTPAQVRRGLMLGLLGVVILGERLDPITVAFSLAVIAVVFVSRHMAVGQPAGS